jgi:hypothetical protein
MGKKKRGGKESTGCHRARFRHVGGDDGEDSAPRCAGRRKIRISAPRRLGSEAMVDKVSAVARSRQAIVAGTLVRTAVAALEMTAEGLPKPKKKCQWFVKVIIPEKSLVFLSC